MHDRDMITLEIILGIKLPVASDVVRLARRMHERRHIPRTHPRLERLNPFAERRRAFIEIDDGIGSGIGIRQPHTQPSVRHGAAIGAQCKV